MGCININVSSICTIYGLLLKYANISGFVISVVSLGARLDLLINYRVIEVTWGHYNPRGSLKSVTNSDGLKY